MTTIAQRDASRQDRLTVTFDLVDAPELPQHGPTPTGQAFTPTRGEVRYVDGELREVRLYRTLPGLDGAVRTWGREHKNMLSQPLADKPSWLTVVLYELLDTSLDIELYLAAPRDAEALDALGG